MYETGHLKDQGIPNFPTIRITEDKICKGLRSAFLRVEVWDYSKSRNHTFISRGVFTIEGLVNRSITQIETLDSKNRKAGILGLDKFQEHEGNSLVDFLKNGLNIYVVYAIDFTGSNGDPKDPKSLHYIQKDKMNPY